MIKTNFFRLLLMGAFVFAAEYVYSADVVQKSPVSVTIPNSDAYNMIEANKKNKNFILLDVRTPGEFSEKRIKGSLNIDFHGPDFTAKLNRLNKSKKVLLYCRSGNRSGQSLPVLKELGFKEVYNMGGGLIEWESNKYPLLRN